MKDAFGGIVNIVLMAVFLLAISGILGLIVSYSKAFKMKNEVISNIEKYQGACFTKASDNQKNCYSRIREGAKSIGYSPDYLNCPSDFDRDPDGNYYCYKKVKAKNGYYYSIITQVDINIPIINRILGISIFQVHGDSRVVDY